VQAAPGRQVGWRQDCGRGAGGAAGQEPLDAAHAAAQPLIGDQALRCPKWAAAKRVMNPSMQKPLMALSQKPKHK
jgi:hypothetical protein